MSIEDLTAVICPPETICEGGNTGDWIDIEKQLGTRLPRDYMDYINDFGTGMIGSYLVIYNPFSSKPSLNLLTQSPSILKEYEAMREYRAVPFNLYPERDSLLPCGLTADGDNVFWLTNDDPKDWTIVIDEMRGIGFEQHNCDLTTFVSRILRKDLMSRIISYRKFDWKALFQPIRP